MVRPFPQVWNVDLIANGRTQLVILASEEESLFSIVLTTGRGRDVQVFLELFRARLRQFLENLGIPAPTRPAVQQITVVGRTNQRVIGSQNDMVHNIRYWLSQAIQPASPGAIREMEDLLNRMPMSYLGRNSPWGALRALTAGDRGVE